MGQSRSPLRPFIALEGDEAGVVLVILSLCLVVLCALVGLVVDSGAMEYRKLTLRKAAAAATLRASQLYYDGATSRSQILAVARETARLNLLASGLDPEQAATAAEAMDVRPENQRRVVRAELATVEPMHFAQLLAGVRAAQPIRAIGAASFERKERGVQHAQHLYVVMSAFVSMAAPFQGNAAELLSGSHAPSRTTRSKGEVGVAGLKQVLDALDGQRLTLVRFGAEAEVLTNKLPVDDHPSPIPGLSNREFAKSQSERLLTSSGGAGLSEALELVLRDMAETLTAEERRETRVVVLTDSIGFELQRPGLGEVCSLDMGRALAAANAIRESGGTVGTLALYTDPKHLALAGESATAVQEAQTMLEGAQLFGRDFLKSLAATHNKEVPCDFATGATLKPSRAPIGRYLEPKTAEEAAIFLDDLLSRPAFLKRLPHRVDPAS